MRISLLKVYSIGKVAKNLEPGSDIIEVIPIEDMPMLDGELTSNATTYAANAASSSGENYSVELQATATLSAHWLPVGQANRLTCPNVRRGEEVVIYRFGDADMYYWNTTRNDLRFRKLETIVFGISATSDEDAEPNADNTYIAEFSTHKKLLHLHTTKANGEPFEFDITLDTGNGIFEMKDDIGNRFFWNSGQNHIRFENSVGSFLELLGNVINQHSDSEWNATTGTANFTFDQFNIKATTEHDGDITHKGNLDRTGNTSLDGSLSVVGGNEATFSGNIKGNGNINLDGSIDAQTGNFPGGVFAPNNKQ